MRRFLVTLLALCLLLAGPGAFAEEKKAADAPKPAETKTSETMMTKLGNMITFYGFLRLDIGFDTSRTNYGNWAFWVMPNKSFDRQMAGSIERVNPGNDAEISINPRLSRFGFNFKAPDITKIAAQLTGQLELDFYGGDVTRDDWKAIPRWRQAWLALTWDWAQLKAGQMSDLMSPMYPRIDGNGGGWFMGNVGLRRPALQLTFNPKLTDQNHRLWIQGSLARPGSLDSLDLDVTDVVNAGVKESTGFVGDGNLDGEDSGVPMVMWRLAFSGPLWNAKPFTIGASGHWQRYQYRYNQWDSSSLVFNKNSMSYFGYSVNAELSLPIMEWWDLRSEFYWGENTQDIFGGIGQGINREASFDASGNFLGVKGVRSLGFWVDTTIHYWPLWAVTLGYMADMPDDDTLPSKNYKLIETTRYKNQGIYLNNEFHLGSGFMVGLEYIAMMTEYRYVQDLTNPSTSSYNAFNNRIRVVFMYSF